MLNTITLIGRLVRNPELRETKSGKKVTNITLAVPRNFKNAEGVYDTDFIGSTIWNGEAEKVNEYCRKGDLISITGRVEKLTGDKEIKIVAEKVIFLQSRKEKEN